MLPFALREGTVGRGRESGERSGPRNVFGVEEGRLAVGPQRVNLYALLEIRSSAGLLKFAVPSKAVGFGVQ